MIEASQIVKRFPGDEASVLDGVSFSLRTGETLAIIGPSGCGKTTLLYIIAGLTHTTSGRVSILGEEVDKPRIRTAVILQDFGLLPWRTVWENVCLGLKIQGVDRKKQAQIAWSLLEEMGLLGCRHRYPLQLSGGEKQRVAVARALATSPDLLLMDEPFSSLDALTREKLQNLVLGIWQKKDLTYLLVTHSIEEAAFLGKYILILSNRPARILKVLPNPGFGNPAYRLERSYFETIRSIRQEMEAREA